MRILGINALFHDPAAELLVLDGRGEAASHRAGRYRDGKLDTLATQALPDSLGLVYEDLTEHPGFLRSSDEYKVMALASYGTPRFLPQLRRYVHLTGQGGFRAHGVDWPAFAPPRAKDEPPAGRPMVDDPRDALECFGSAPVDLLAIGPYAVRRGRTFDTGRAAA